MADAQNVQLVERAFTPLYVGFNLSGHPALSSDTSALSSDNSALASDNASAGLSLPGNGTGHWMDWEQFSSVAPVVFLAPFLGLPALLFITTATIREHVSDPLVAFALVVAGKFILDEGLLILGSPLCLAAIVSAKLALIARLASTKYDHEPRPDPPVVV